MSGTKEATIDGTPDPEAPGESSNQSSSEPGGIYSPPLGEGFSLQSLVQRSRAVLTQPSVATFDAQQSAANWQSIFISLAILAAVAAICRFIWGLEPHTPVRYPSVFGNIVKATTTPLGGAAFAVADEFAVFFAVGGVLYVSARCLGGRGSFLAQSWLLALAIVPLAIISSVVALIPIIDNIGTAFAVIYELVLVVLALASAHRVSIPRAVSIILAPIAVLLALACILSCVVALLIQVSGHSLPH